MVTLKNVKINDTMEADEMDIDIDDLLKMIANDHKGWSRLHIGGDRLPYI